MPFDFPSSPTTGQVIPGPGGTQYMFDGVKWIPAPRTPPDPQANIGRNVLHNSMFRIQQRGAGPWSANQNYTADRWLIGVSTSTITTTLIAMADVDRAAIGDESASYMLQSVVGGTSGAGDFANIGQRIEDIKRLSGKTVVLSFWAKATSGTPKLGYELAQNFGAGGSPSATVTNIGSNAVTLTTNWARYTTTPIAIPSASGKTFGTTAGTDFTALFLWFSSGATNNSRAGNIGVQSATFQLWGAQLEVGSTVTPLEKIDMNLDLSNCQRFYQVGNVFLASYGAAGQGFQVSVPFATAMRAGPTIAYSNTNYTNTSGITTFAVNNTMVVPQVVVTAAGSAVYSSNYTASADL